MMTTKPKEPSCEQTANPRITRKLPGAADVVIVVYGPPASGKTLNREVLQRAFAARMVWDEGTEGLFPKPLKVGGSVLVLTNDAERVGKTLPRTVKREWWPVEEALQAAQALGYAVRWPGEVDVVTPAEGDDQRWAEDVLPLVVRMMKLRGYTELRVEVLPNGFRYEMTQEVEQPTEGRAAA